MRVFIGLLCPFFLLLFVTGSALSKETVKHPVVVVPGILGSKLCTKSNAVVWGTKHSLKNFSRLRLDVAKPEKLHACGLIDRVEVLGPLYSIKAYDALLKTLENMGFKENENLFLFDYDWRQSNFDSAAKLEAFIDQIKRDGKIGSDFDIIAHSMGGIVSRIYLKDNPSSGVKKIFYFGTPFLGSANTLGTLSEGWGGVKNWLAGGQKTIRAVTLSFPSILELLPRYDECCYVKNSDNSKRYLDIFSADEWSNLGWIPKQILDDKTRLKQFKTNLKNAGSLSELLKSPLKSITEYLFIADAHPTRTYFAIKDGATSPSSSNWYFTEDKGDGTVPAWSAARNPSSTSLSGAEVSFAEHATIFDDEAAQTKLAWELLDVTPANRQPIKGGGHPVISATLGGVDRNWTIETIRLSIPAPVLPIGPSFKARATINLDMNSHLQPGLVAMSGTVRQGKLTFPIVPAEITSSKDIKASRLVFEYTIKTNNLSEGGVEIEFSLPTVRNDANTVARAVMFSK